MTVKEFMETYKGFDWHHGEIVIVDQRRGKRYIFSNENKGTLYDSIFKEEIANRSVWDWTHTVDTMLIIL